MKQRWEDWINLVIGVWLFLSPWILGYIATRNAASWNAFIVGGAFVVFTVWALSIPKPWEEWINALLGLWLVISPWVLGFAGSMTAMWNALICGAIVLVISLEATRSSRQPPLAVT